MTERARLSQPFSEGIPAQRQTKLSMIIDPPKQSPVVAAERVGTFIKNGGRAVLIGGSGEIDSDLFEETVERITRVTSSDLDVPVWILPGHIGQIPLRGKGIAGVLNYVHIMGSNSGFEDAYPQDDRSRVANILAQRKIPNISTLYILCGDPNASVSQVSGILPLNFSSPEVIDQLLKETLLWLKRKVQCVFFESGSNNLQHADRSSVLKVRHLIDWVSPDTTLIVSGGVRTPDQARLFAGIADYVNIGGHFERNGVEDATSFVNALR